MKKVLEQRLRALEDQHLRRSTVVLDPVAGPVVRVGGREVLNLSSNDYLGLTAEPALMAALRRTTADRGSGAGAARLVTGTQSVHEKLERELAEHLDTPRALLFGSGYLANVGVLAALGAEGGTIISDESNHASIVDGCRLARARVLVYRHLDVDHVRELLSDAEPPVLVVTESVFSMDGDRGPLEKLCDAASEAGAWVYVDEAHAYGHLGPAGRGLSSMPQVSDRVDVRMGTLGKALGCYGAFVAGGEELAEYLVSRARTFLYSTALPPGIVDAAREALKIVAGPRGDVLRARLGSCIRSLRLGLMEQGWELLDVPGPILPVMVGDAQQAVALSEKLMARGLLVRAMRYPTVKPGTERLRMVASAALTDEHIDRALAEMGKLRKEL